MNNQKILNLTLKRKSFLMVLLGEQTEVYKEFKSYWYKRLIKREYNIIRFRNGRQKNSPVIDIELKKIRKGQGETKWGAPKHFTYIIELGDLISYKYCNDLYNYVQMNLNDDKSFYFDELEHIRVMEENIAYENTEYTYTYKKDGKYYLEINQDDYEIEGQQIYNTIGAFKKALDRYESIILDIRSVSLNGSKYDYELTAFYLL